MVESPWRQAPRLEVTNCHLKLNTWHSILNARMLNTCCLDTQRSRSNMGWAISSGMGGERGSGFSSVMLAAFYGHFFSLSVPVDLWTSNISPSSSPHPSCTISISSRIDRVLLFYPNIPSLGRVVPAWLCLRWLWLPQPVSQAKAATAGLFWQSVSINRTGCSLITHFQLHNRLQHQQLHLCLTIDRVSLG
jgi:hypothetical protein